MIELSNRLKNIEYAYNMLNKAMLDKEQRKLSQQIWDDTYIELNISNTVIIVLK